MGIMRISDVKFIYIIIILENLFQIHHKRRKKSPIQFNLSWIGNDFEKMGMSFETKLDTNNNFIQTERDWAKRMIIKMKAMQ